MLLGFSGVAPASMLITEFHTLRIKRRTQRTYSPIKVVAEIASAAVGDRDPLHFVSGASAERLRILHLTGCRQIPVPDIVRDEHAYPLSTQKIPRFYSILIAK